MSATGSTTQGRLALQDSDADEDAPTAPAAETPSSTLRRVLGDVIPAALATGASLASKSRFASTHPLAARILRWAAVLLTVIGGGGAATWAAVGQAERQDCDPIVLQHILHLAETGEELAIALDAEGRHVQAERVRDMTGPKRLPDDLQLCVLLQHRQGAPQ